MRDAPRRPMGWLFYWALVLSSAIGFWLSAFGIPVPPQSGAGTTSVSDNGLPGGWDSGFRQSDCQLAGVCNGWRDCGGGGHYQCDAGC